jgi:hypothetical protein
VSICALGELGNRSSYTPECGDNDGLHTAEYIASQAFRFAVTRVLLSDISRLSNPPPPLPHLISLLPRLWLVTASTPKIHVSCRMHNCRVTPGSMLRRLEAFTRSQAFLGSLLARFFGRASGFHAPPRAGGDGTIARPCRATFGKVRARPKLGLWLARKIFFSTFWKRTRLNGSTGAARPTSSCQLARRHKLGRGDRSYVCAAPRT